MTIPPSLVLAFFNGAVSLAKDLAPVVAQMRKDGQISPEDQEKTRANLDALRSDAAFSGSEWRIDPPESPRQP